MKNLLILTLGVVLALIAFATPAAASPPIQASGQYEAAGSDFCDGVTLSGTFTGSLIPLPNPTIPGACGRSPNSQADAWQFTGTVAGLGSGSVAWNIVYIRANGTGRWTISAGGEGDLANVRGQGTFTCTTGGAYEGQLYIAP
jgi:hypothetical protein